MRDGRRQRLGLATGTEDPATSNDGYLDRILSDQEAAEQSNILNLAQDANVNVRDQRYLNDAYQYYLGGGTGEVPTTTVAPDFTGGELIDTGGGGQDIATSGLGLGDTTPIDTTITPTNLNDFDNTYTGTPGGNTGSGDFDLIDNSGKSFGPYSQTPVTPNETSLGNTNTGLEDYLNIDYTTPVNTPSGRNPFGYEDLNPSALAGPGINETSGLDDIGADIGVDNTVDYGMPQGSPGQLNPAAPSIDDITTDFSKPNIGEISGPATMTVDELAASSADQGLDAFDPSAVSQAFTAGKQAIASGISTVAEVGQSIANTIGGVYNGIDQTVSVFGKEINVPGTLAGIALSQVVGAPVNIAFGVAKAIGGALPQYEPTFEETTLANEILCIWEDTFLAKMKKNK